ncbi:MAG: alpha/beta hydrolase, partial [Candidatus Solibacter sp.]
WITGLLLAASLAGADVKYDGAKVHYESYGKGQEAVVFIHGWTCDLTFWRGQAPLYEKRRALLIDLPGHGQSEAPKVDYTMERFARAIDAVMRDAGVTKGVLVGHSMGGPVVLAYLRLFPAKTSGLVLVDALLQAATSPEGEAKAKAQMEPFLAGFEKPDYKETMAKMITSMYSAKTTPAMRTEITAKMTATPQPVVVGAMRGMFAMPGVGKDEKYDVPVLVIMNATPARPGYEERLRATFPKLRGYESWEGMGHFLMMEDPARFNTAVAKFLDQR